MAKTREVLKIAVEIGDLLLRNGAEVYRVEDTVMHILKSYDIKDCDVYVLSNGIFASANEHTDEACSMIRHVPLGSVHLGRIAALNQLSRELCEKKSTIDEAWLRIPQCKTIPVVSNIRQMFFCGLGSGCFSYLFGGTFLDLFVAFFVGAVLQYLLITIRPKKVSKFITNILGSALVTTLSLLFLNIGLPVLYDKIIIGAIMPLVPGIALTTSIRDLFNGDYVSGSIHLMDALLTAFCIAVGVGTIITLYQYIPGGIIL